MTADPAQPKPSAAVRLVKCPGCGGDSVYAPSNRYRPFCSERCKAIDLGTWSSEGYVVPVAPTTADLPELDA